MLLLVEDFVEAVHGQESNPGHTKLRDDLVRHCGLPAGRTSTHSDHKGLNLCKDKTTGLELISTPVTCCPWLSYQGGRPAV